MSKFAEEKGLNERDPSLPPKPPTPRQIKIYELSAVRNWTYAEIARWYRKQTGQKISQQRIAQIIARVKPWAFQQTMENVIEIRTGLTAQCNSVIREAWKGWYKSRKDGVVSKRKFTASDTEFEMMLEYGHAITDQEREEVKTGQCGDTRYLSTILDAVKHIRSMWAIDEKTNGQLPNLIPAGPLVQVNNGNPQAMITIVEIPDNGRDPEIVAEYRREDEKRRKLLEQQNCAPAALTGAAGRLIVSTAGSDYRESRMAACRRHPMCGSVVIASSQRRPVVAVLPRVERRDGRSTPLGPRDRKKSS